MEYLNRDVESDNQTAKEHINRPSSPLIVDSVSGIYIGYDEENDVEEEGDDDDDDIDNEDRSSSNVNNQSDSCDSGKTKQGWKIFKIKKQGSKYTVNCEHHHQSESSTVEGRDQSGFYGLLCQKI